MKAFSKYLLICLSLLFAINQTNAQNTIDQVDTSYDGVSKLIIKGSFCDVSVMGSNNESKVMFVGKITGTENNKEYKIMHRQSGNTLEVWIDRPERNWNMGWNNLNGKLDFKVSAKIDLIINNSSGDVIAENLSGNICEVSATSGDVKAINIGTNLKIVATSGDIKTENVQGEVRARTTSGNQQINTVTGRIEADATSGDIRIGNCEGNVEATTTSGEIDMQNAKGLMSLRSTSGNIEGKDVTLTGDATFKSTSGTIEIRLKNNMKDLTFDLEATSGNLRAGEIRADRRLFVKNGEGNIKIRGVSSSGNQSYSE
jgi:hypothetical protein